VLDPLPEARRRPRLIIGVGNPLRRDDAAGLAVAERVGGLAHEGECSPLGDLWAGRDDVVLVDASASGAEPGTVRRFDASDEPLHARTMRSSTHAFGVPEAIELARSLDRLPAQVTVYAIEGADFRPGAGLTPAVERGVADVATASDNGAS
jgi:hydrogenase maturation protease